MSAATKATFSEFVYIHEGRHARDCAVARKAIDGSSGYRPENAWAFTGEIEYRSRTGRRHRNGNAAFLVGRCNDIECEARVLVRAQDLSRYIAEVPF